MGNKGTFLIRMVDRQNASWQGTVTWLEKQETEKFRSMLELIRLLDSAVDDEKEAENSECGVSEDRIFQD